MKYSIFSILCSILYILYSLFYIICSIFSVLCSLVPIFCYFFLCSVISVQYILCSLFSNLCCIYSLFSVLYSVFSVFCSIFSMKTLDLLARHYSTAKGSNINLTTAVISVVTPHSLLPPPPPLPSPSLPQWTNIVISYLVLICALQINVKL